MALSYCTIIFIFIQSSIIIVNSSPVVQIKVKRSNICDNVKCLPGYQCCEEGRDACGGNECEQCIDGTFSSGEVGEYCENCNECRDGEVMIKTCTRVEDAVCECPYGKYITNYGACKPCSICEGEDCKKCNVTTTPKSTPTPLKKSTTPAETTVMTTPTTSTSIPPTTNNQEEGSSWKDGYLVPIVLSPLFLLAVAAVIIKVTCFWSEDSQRFWANYFPCFCKIPNDMNEAVEVGTVISKNKSSTLVCCCSKHETGGGNAQNNTIPANDKSEQLSPMMGASTLPSDESQNGPTVTYKPDEETAQISVPSNSGAGDNADGKSVPNDGIKSQGDDNISNTSSADSVFSRQDSVKSEEEPLMNKSQKKQTNGNSRNVKKFMRRRSSNLDDVPENAPLSVDLPEWCKQDNSRVESEHVSEISRHIGNHVANIGNDLGLTKGEVETIEHNHKSDLSRQNLEVLQQWMEKNGVFATKSSLARALKKSGKSELAMMYLWSEQERNQGMSKSTKITTFWRRRKSQQLDVKLDSGYFRDKDWTMQSTWQEIWKIMLENNYGDFKQFKLACGTVEYPQPPLECVQSCPYFNSSSHGLDQCAVQMMQIKHLYPVNIPHGVNCLFSAASVIYYGSEDNFLELKLRTVIELAYHKDHYMRQKALIKCIKAEYALTNVGENDVLTKSKDIEANFEKAVRQTVSEQNLLSLQGNSIQLFGLASVLNCNIQSVFPTMGASETSPLNVLITPRKEQENPATVFIMWSRHTPLPEDGQFVPNHFVPLLQEPPTTN